MSTTIDISCRWSTCTTDTWRWNFEDYMHPTSYPCYSIIVVSALGCTFDLLYGCLPSWQAKRGNCSIKVIRSSTSMLLLTCSDLMVLTSNWHILFYKICVVALQLKANIGVIGWMMLCPFTWTCLMVCQSFFPIKSCLDARYDSLDYHLLDNHQCLRLGGIKILLYSFFPG